MNTKGEHLEYVAHMGLFHLDCTPNIFTPEELQVLEKWGYWFAALESGDLKPFTEAQERFLRVMKREEKPQTIEESAWFKYRGRKAIEKQYGDRLNVRYAAEDDSFYSIDDKKKMNKINFSTMARNHHKGLSER